MSIYPGRGGPGESWFYPSRDLNGNPAISDDEEFQEDENDWMDNAEVPAKSTRKNPSKFSESIATEVSFSTRLLILTLLNNTILFLETVLGGP